MIRWEARLRTWEIADEIAMEWKRVPMMPDAAKFDAAWRNILARAREKHGKEAVTKALGMMQAMYGGSVPAWDVE